MIRSWSLICSMIIYWSSPELRRSPPKKMFFLLDQEMMIDYHQISLNIMVILSFRPRFASKCDRQSRDLTQLTRGYNSSVRPLLISADHFVRTHTWENIAHKYSREIMNIFSLFREEGKSISDTLASKSNAFSIELCPRLRSQPWYQTLIKSLISK